MAVEPAQEPSDRWSPETIGRLVATYRGLRNLKVSELARRVGVTPSLISQIEHGNSRPSVATLFALAEALDVSVDVFAGRPAPAAPAAPAATAAVTHSGRYAVRRADRRAIAIEGGVRWELLTPTANPECEFLELVYSSHAESNPTQYRHPGSEMLLVLSGRFLIHVGFETYDLGPGDSIYFPSTVPHRYVNPTDAESRAVTLILRDAQAPDAALTALRHPSVASLPELQ